MARKNIEKLKIKLLAKSAKTCNVCTDNTEVIVHHIDEDKTNNVEDNLIVLCISCHGKAHSKHQFSLNLTSNRLKKLKKEWEHKVENRSNLAIDEFKISQQKEKNKEKSSEEEKHLQDVREKFKKLDDIYKYNLDTSKKLKVDEKMIELFTKYKAIVSKVYDPEQLKRHIDKIEDTLAPTKLKLKQEILEYYFINVMNSEDNLVLHREHFLNINMLLNFYPDFEEYLNKYRQDYTYKPQTLLDFFDILIDKQIGHLSKKQEIILFNCKDDIKQEIISQPIFFKKVISLVEKSTYSSDINCLKEIIRELENENDEYKSIIRNIRDTSSSFENKMG